MTWRVEWSGAARREMRRLDRGVAERVRQAILDAAEKESGDIIHLRGMNPPEWRLRVGDWRVLFRFEDTDAIRVLHVLPRGRAYR